MQPENKSSINPPSPRLADMATDNSGCAGRESGRGALLGKVAQLRREANKLEVLAHAIPDNFPADADEGLWNLVYRRI